MADFLKFRDETNRFAVFSSALVLNIGTGAYQFQFKLRMISLPASGSVGLLGTNSASTATGLLISSTGALRVLTSGTQRYASADGFILNDGNWHVYRIEHDAGGAWRMYRDNLTTPVATGTFSTTSSANNFNSFGRSSTASTTLLDADLEYFEATGSVTNADRWDAEISDLTSSTLTAVGGNNATLQSGFPTDNSQWGTEASVIPVSFSGSISNQVFTVGDAVDVDLTTGFTGTETPFTYVNTGTALTGSGLSINTSGHLMGTAVESSIVGVVITATDTGTDTASSNSFNVTVVPPTGDLEIETVFDLSNVSSVNSVVTNPSGAEPTVLLVPRDESMTADGNWRNLIGKLTGCSGKRPIVRFDRSTQDTPTAPRASTWRCYWSTDFVTFNAFPAADTSSGSTGYYQVQATEAFEDDTVYVMTNPVYPQAQANDFSTALLTTYSSIAEPTAYAVAAKVANPSWPAGAVFVTDSSNDYPTETGEQISGANLGSLPIYGFKLDWGTSEGGTTDGGPKRKAVLTYGQHAQGEAQASVSYFGALNWLLTSSDTQAINLRRNFVFYVYFNINGSGIKGGHRRLSYGTGSSNTNRSQDFNRVWDQTTPTVPEVRYTRDAILSDTAADATVLIDWHGKGDAIGDYNSIESSVYGTANNGTWLTLATANFNMTNADVSTVADTGGYIINWAYDALGVDYSTHAEHANRGNNSKSNLESVGENWLRTLQDADAGGMFYDAPPVEPPAGVVTISSITPSPFTATVVFSYSAADQTGFEYRLGTGAASPIAGSPVTVSGLTPATTYSLQVRAVNSAGESAWSSAVDFETLEYVPPDPSDTYQGRKLTLIQVSREAYPTLTINDAMLLYLRDQYGVLNGLSDLIAKYLTE